MYSITGRIERIKQPYGGFIKRTDFEIIQLHDDQMLHEEENITPSLVGTAVDYLTRFMMGTPVEQAFEISIKGAHHAKEDEKADELIKSITGLNKESAIAACKLAGYDVCYRIGMSRYKPVSEINPDDGTAENVIIMVSRSVDFWKEYGPIVLDGFTFEGGYTPIVSTGDGDFLTKDTLWDFKVLKQEPTSRHTLQLLMYYIMGKRYNHKEFDSIEYIGLFNPRKNKVYRYPVKDIPEETISTVSHDVIGYDWKDKEYEAFFKEKLGRALSQSTLKKEISILPQKNVSVVHKYSEFEIGDRVFSKKFGEGVVLNVTEHKFCAVADVRFDSGVEKHVVTTYLERASK